MGLDEEALIAVAASEEGAVRAAGDSQWLPSVGTRYPIRYNRLCNLWKTIDPSKRTSLTARFKVQRERNS
jgi:hypothetical protein